MLETRQCIGCQKTVRGRTDKKFCTDSCRNNYHNQLKAANNNLMRNINNALGKNRRILQEILGDKPVAKISKEFLLLNGFHLRYFTHTEANGKALCYYCYEYGYRTTSKDQLMIVRAKQYDRKKISEPQNSTAPEM